MKYRICVKAGKLVSENRQKTRGGQAVGKSAKVIPQEQSDEEAASSASAVGYLLPAHS